MSPSLLCETVTGDTMAELVAARDAAARADMVELRLDGVADLDVAQALHGRRVPVDRDLPPDVGRRPVRGQRGGAAPAAQRAFELGAEYVDIEWRAELRRPHPCAYPRGSLCRPTTLQAFPATSAAGRVRCARQVRRSSRWRSPPRGCRTRCLCSRSPRAVTPS